MQTACPFWRCKSLEAGIWVIWPLWLVVTIRKLPIASIHQKLTDLRQLPRWEQPLCVEAYRHVYPELEPHSQLKVCFRLSCHYKQFFDLTPQIIRELNKHSENNIFVHILLLWPVCLSFSEKHITKCLVANVIYLSTVCWWKKTKTFLSTHRKKITLQTWPRLRVTRLFSFKLEGIE